MSDMPVLHRLGGQAIVFKSRKLNIRQKDSTRSFLIAAYSKVVAVTLSNRGPRLHPAWALGTVLQRSTPAPENATFVMGDVDVAFKCLPDWHRTR